MKDKKGFTLIELLITISIMALLLILVMPAIKSLQNTNKETGFEYYRDSLIEAAKVYITKEGEDINEYGYSNWKGCVDITYNDLITADLIKPYNDDIDCSSSFIRYTKTSNGNSKYTYKMICKNKDDEEVYNENNLESDDACSVINKDDKIPPICGSTTGENTIWTRDSVEITIECSDDQSGCKSVTKNFTETTKVGYIEIEDGNGNKTNCPVNVYIDKTPPTCVSSGGSTSWTRNAVTITGTCNDDESGCSSNVTKTYDSEGNFINQSPGIVKDNLGNQTICPANQTIRIDRTPPNVSFECIKSPQETNQTLIKAHITDSLSGYNCFSANWSSGSDTICRSGLNSGVEEFNIPNTIGEVTFTSLCDIVGNCIPNQLSYNC